MAARVKPPAETVLTCKSSERQWLTGIFFAIIASLLIFGLLFGLTFSGLQRQVPKEFVRNCM
jgi:hypothetical protein